MEVTALSKSKRKNNKKLQKQIKMNNLSVQDFFEIKEIKNNSILTTHNEELYYLEIKPKNISVLSDKATLLLISELSEVISSVSEIELLCLNSSQDYDANKEYINALADSETNPVIKDLDKKDAEHLENIKISMATSRVFYMVVRCNAADSEQDKTRKVSNVLQIANEHNFDVSLSDKKSIKKMLAIYLEQNVYQDDFPDFDGQQCLNGELLQPDNLKNFVDIISPSVMNFKHSNYYIIGNTYRTVWAIREYATTTEQMALLRELGEADGVTLHIYNRLVSEGEKNKVFDYAQRRDTSIFNTSKSMKKQVEGQENLTDLQRLIRDSYKSKESFVQCAVFIEMISSSLEKLKILTTSVAKILHSSHIIRDNLLLQQRDGFASVAPFGFNMFGKEFERILPSSSAANLFPFSYSGRTDKKGIYIGKDVHGSNIIIDFDERSLDITNGHISIFGNSGQGKSYLVKLLICLFRQKQKSVYSLDVDSEYIDVTNGLGGTNVDMMSGQYYINLMQIRLVKSADDRENNEFPDEIAAAKKGTLLAQHIAFLRDFFKVYKPELTSSQLDILEIMLSETYRKFRITNTTDISKLKADDFPILSDLYETCENELNHYDDKAHKGKEMLYSKENLRGVLLAINSICVGTDAIFFNGITNIPNADHVNFVVTDVLNTNENLKNAMYFNIFSFMQHKYFSEGNTVVITDEIHEIVKSFIVVMYLRSFVKRGRKRNSNTITASQNIEDLMISDIIDYTRPLFSIPSHQFLFNPGTVDEDKFKATTSLTDTEFSIIDTPKQGFCLYRCGNERYHIHIIAPEHKSCLFGDGGGK